MAKYKASPFYSVHTPTGKINFNHIGEYSTTNEDEVAILSTLCPRYLVCVDEGKAKSKPSEVKEAPKQNRTNKPKSSGK